MDSKVCKHCRESWPVLNDGTMIEHPQKRHPALLCPGSRRQVAKDSQAPARPATVYSQLDGVFTTN
jgi:hypothetical protein